MPDLGAVPERQPRAEECVLNGIGRLVLAEPARAQPVNMAAVAVVERSSERAGRRIGRQHVTPPVSPPR